MTLTWDFPYISYQPMVGCCIFWRQNDSKQGFLAELCCADPPFKIIFRWFHQNPENVSASKASSFSHDFAWDVCSSCHIEVLNLVGGSTTHLKNKLVKLDHLPRDRGENSKNIWVATTWATFKTLLTFYYIDWLIGILIMAYYKSPYIYIYV